jgi:nucleotide-binding universal stress UspA family protein
MKQFQRVLVCIETLDKARDLLACASAVSRAVEAREIHLLHVQCPAATRPKMSVNGVAIARKSITTSILRNTASELFKGHGREKVQCAVVGGSPLPEIIRYARNKEVDLVILGRRAGQDASIAFSRRVASKVRCSVLVLPDGAGPQWNRILVPARNSECSANALAAACGIGAATGAEVVCLNVYWVRSGYLNIGTSREKQIAVMGEWAQRECEQLRDRTDTAGANVTVKCVPDLYHKPVPAILEQIGSESADLLVIGAHGRRGIAGMLLGNVTDQIIRRSNVPILAVKKKGEAVGFARAVRMLAG